MIIIAEGGYRSCKTIILVYCALIARRGGVNKMLRRIYRKPYRIVANMAMFAPFCPHPPRMKVDWDTKQIQYYASCSCLIAQKGGNLNPLDLVQRAVRNEEFAPYTALVGHEWHRWQESRITAMLPKKSQLNRLLTNYFFDETGKRHFDFMLDTQNRYKLDNRIRDFAGYLIVCENMAADTEHDFPQPHYSVVKDPFAFHPQVQEYYPPSSWARMLMPMYDTWETPRYRSEAEIAVEELETDLKKMEQNIKRIEGTVLEPEMEYEGRRARRTMAASYSRLKHQVGRPAQTQIPERDKRVVN